jgi:hypothetical protein
MENIALRWLAYEKKCVAVLHERTPRQCAGQPDVLGVTQARHLIEIEIKRSVSDFRANAKKWHIANREHYIKNQPRQFYYFVPDGIFEKCKLILPEWAGLARLRDGYQFHVEVQAPINNQSRRLSVKESIKLVRNMPNQIVSFSDAIENWKTRFQEGLGMNTPKNRDSSTSLSGVTRFKAHPVIQTPSRIARKSAPSLESTCGGALASR